MKTLAKHLGVLFVLTAQLAYGAQSIPASFYNISTFEGLPSNTVGSVLKDSLGFIWIGTKSGLCRFDGCEIRKYESLGEVDIWSMEELNQDTLLLGTISDLRIYNRRTQTVSAIDIMPTLVKAIKKIDNSSFFAGTASGLYYVKSGVAQRIIFDTGYSFFNDITSIIKQDEDTYWFSTDNGLGEIDLKTFRTSIYRMKNGLLNSNNFTCLTQVGEYIYLGSFNKGVFRFHIDSQQFEPVPGFENDLVMTINHVDNHLYVGTNGRGLKIMSLDSQKLSVILHKEKNKHSIGSNTITSFLYDNGILWIGTQFKGVSYNLPEESKFSYYTNNNFYSTDHNVRSFYAFENGDKLIGTRDGLLYVSEKKNIVKSYSIENSASHLRSNIIVFIGKVKDKILICTYGGGVYVFNPQTLSLEDFSPEEDFQYGCFFRCVEDKKGDLWFAGTEGIYHATISGGLIHKYDVTNSGLNTNTIIYLYCDSFDRLWIGTIFGLYLMDMGTRGIRSSDFLKQPINSFIQYIMEDSQNDVWVCTNDGLYRIGSDLFLAAHYTRNDFLPDNIVKSAVEDKSGFLWFATLKEIVRYELHTGASYVYQKMDGLEGYDFNNTVFLDDDGTIWWANEGGLIYKSGKEEESKMPQRVVTPIITSYATSDEEYDPIYMEYPVKVTLPPSPNHIHIRFSNMNYYPPYASMYEYMLEGYDLEWQKQEGINEVKYTNLPSGKYLFKLRNSDGSVENQMLVISVSRSYYIYMWIGIVVLVILFFPLFYTNKIKMLKKRMMDERAILKSVREQVHAKNSSVHTSEIPENDYLMEQLLKYMDKEKPYLNPKLNINDVAARLDCTASDLSFFLNKHMHVNFSNFINTYRVNEIKQRLNEDNLSKYTLKALSEQCGFNSQTTFYRVFKSMTGTTPLEYCKKMNLTIKED